MTQATAPAPGAALAGLRVIELASAATRYCGKLFRDLGAEVVLVEHEAKEGCAPDVIAERYYDAGKVRIVLDLATPEGRADLIALGATADLLLDGLAPGRLEDLGLGYERLAHANPGLVLTRITPFGQTGPYAGFAADDLTLLALGGLLVMGGYADGQPVAAYGGQSALAGSVFGAVASLAAVLSAEQTGQGDEIDVSMQEAVVMALENAAQFYQLEGKLRHRIGGTQSAAGNGQFHCKDGWFYLLAGGLSSTRFLRTAIAWLRDEEAEQAEELQGDRWEDRAFLNSDEGKSVFERVFGKFARERTQDELYAECRARRIPGAPVLAPSAVASSRQRAHRGFFVDTDALSPGQNVPVPGAPYKLSATPCLPPTPAMEAGASDRIAAAGKPRGAGPFARTNKRPLEGVRITDFTWIGAGAYTTKILADLGADVIKIESSQKVDDLRLSPPFAGGVKGVNRSGYFADRNTSKRSITVDLKTQEGRRLVHDLVTQSHVVADNFAPGVMARLDIDYDTLVKVNDRIVTLSMSGQGADGPESDVIGFGLTLGALTGLHYLSGEPDREPVGTGTHYPDHIPNPGHAAFAVLAALRHQRRAGQGQYIDLAQTEPTIAMIGPAIVTSMIDGRDVQRTGNRNGEHAPRGVFPCQGDDRWIAITVRTDAEWRAVLDVLGATNAPPTWSETDGRLSDQDGIEKWLAERTAAWEATDLMLALQQVRVAAGIVQTAQDLVDDDPQMRARAHWCWLDHPEMGRTLHNGQPFKFARTDVAPRAPAPLLGQHTDEVLAGVLNLDAARIAELRAMGALN